MSETHYQSIRNTLSRYCIALDTKNFPLLRQVFSENAETEYPPLGGKVVGVESLMGRLEERLKPVITHHSLSTQVIEIAEDGKSAKTETHFTGVHLGKGKWEGESSTAFGRYIDDLSLVGEGKWLITKRDVQILGRVGNGDVMKGEE